MSTTELNAAVSQRIEVTPGLIVLRVVPDGWQLPDFEPGQYAVLALPGSAPRIAISAAEEPPQPPDKLIKRAYSIASSSLLKEYMEFYITLVPSGALTPRLFALREGDRVWLSPGAKGVFTLDRVPAGKHIAFLATGTGLAPYMSMLRTSLVCGGPINFGVLHGARHSWDLGYRSELRTLERMCTNFAYVPIIDEPEQEAIEWRGEVGWVQDLWTRGVLARMWGLQPTPDDTHVFLCGNPAMIEAVTELLEGEGFKVHSRQQPGEIHVEKYW
jgi:ferredoxin--NADP+ reductase